MPKVHTHGEATRSLHLVVLPVVDDVRAAVDQGVRSLDGCWRLEVAVGVDVPDLAVWPGRLATERVSVRHDWMLGTLYGLTIPTGPRTS